jgi:hypothetical protein
MCQALLLHDEGLARLSLLHQALGQECLIPATAYQCHVLIIQTINWKSAGQNCLYVNIYVLAIGSGGRGRKNISPTVKLGVNLVMIKDHVKHSFACTAWHAQADASTP